MADINLTRQDAINLVSDILYDGLDAIYSDSHAYVDERVVGSDDELDDIAEALGAEAEGIIQNVLKALARWEY